MKDKRSTGNTNDSRISLSILLLSLLIVGFLFLGISQQATALYQDPPAQQDPPTQQDPPAQQDPSGSDDLLEDDMLGDDMLGDDMLGDDMLGDDMLGDDTSEVGKEEEPEKKDEASAAHEKIFAASNFPSADECALCHPKQYKEWSVSQHAYSQLSPMMMSMQNAMNVGTSTTNGDFCLRCHAPVGSDIGEPFSASNLDRHPASREGITCVTCHRMSAGYRKVSGRIGIDQGDIFDSVKGALGNEELARVLADTKQFKE